MIFLALSTSACLFWAFACHRAKSSPSSPSRSPQRNPPAPYAWKIFDSPTKLIPHLDNLRQVVYWVGKNLHCMQPVPEVDVCRSVSRSSSAHYVCNDTSKHAQRYLQELICSGENANQSFKPQGMQMSPGFTLSLDHPPSKVMSPHLLPLLPSQVLWASEGQAFFTSSQPLATFRGTEMSINISGSSRPSSCQRILHSKNANGFFKSLKHKTKKRTASHSGPSTFSGRMIGTWSTIIEIECEEHMKFWMKLFKCLQRFWSTT